jgi:predicted RNA-binding protein with PIN domain
MTTMLLMFSLSGLAHDHKEMDKMMDKMSFEDARKMKLDMLDKHQSMMDEERKCINDAKDKEGLKMCMKAMWEKKEKMKDEMKMKMKK